MSELSDTELKDRLEAHNYRVPPITSTTRGFLRRKLVMLDEKNGTSIKGKRFGIFCYFDISKDTSMINSYVN